MKAQYALSGLAYLFVLFAVACLMLGWVTAAAECPGKPEEWPRECSLLKFIFDWQQLLGSFVAIGAAAIGWHAINRQIVQADEHERERHRRRLAGSRAVLPLALSGVSTYATRCCISLLPLYIQSREHAEIQMPEGGWSAPELPASAILELRSLVEASPPAVANAVAMLLTELQVQASRIESLQIDILNEHSVVTRNDIEQFIVDTIEVQALTNELFAYGRGEQEAVLASENGPSLAQMKTAAMGLYIFPGHYPGIDARIARHHGTDRSDDGDDF